MSAVSFSYIYLIHGNRTGTQAKISKSKSCRAVLDLQAIPALAFIHSLQIQNIPPVCNSWQELAGISISQTCVNNIHNRHVFLMQVSTSMRANTQMHLIPLHLIKASCSITFKTFWRLPHRRVLKLKVCVELRFQHNATTVCYLL